MTGNARPKPLAELITVLSSYADTLITQRSQLIISQVYLSKVSNSATADGSAPFFKIYEDTWGRNTAGGGGSDDYWGTKDLNTHCGKLDVKIPSGLAPGDYLLRAEAIALHAAGGSGGAQVSKIAASIFYIG